MRANCECGMFDSMKPLLLEVDGTNSNVISIGIGFSIGFSTSWKILKNYILGIDWLWKVHRQYVDNRADTIIAMSSVILVWFFNSIFNLLPFIRFFASHFTLAILVTLHLFTFRTEVDFKILMNEFIRSVQCELLINKVQLVV